MRGQVERLVPAEGFGVVRGEDGHEYFIHASAMNSTDFGELAAETVVRGSGSSPV